MKLRLGTTLCALGLAGVFLAGVTLAGCSDDEYKPGTPSGLIPILGGGGGGGGGAW